MLPVGKRLIVHAPAPGGPTLARSLDPPLVLDMDGLMGAMSALWNGYNAARGTYGMAVHCCVCDRPLAPLDTDRTACVVSAPGRRACGHPECRIHEEPRTLFAAIVCRRKACKKTGLARIQAWSERHVDANCSTDKDILCRTRCCDGCARVQFVADDDANGDAKFLKCGRCEAVYYCDVQCQRYAWPVHKTTCCPRKHTTIPSKDDS